ncbi:VOC family protein [Shewanella sp. WXL01]|uniref:VOC family protein n=1 Tax=Shewanella maritima TaxID=2520507 RepID=A0A411PDW8_9GAMM|nr:MULTISPECIES: VOC family protein [Shewanella]NKF50266.1 VOC family protein [Shewanella sp. WXL01]QBF81704.1 VOC family protein [Shewanella maritima]
MNLNQVTIPVTDMAAACVFYRKLGMTQIVDTAHYARFRCPQGESTFSLALTSERIENPSVIYFEHEQLDDWVASLISKGIEIAQMPTEQSYLWKEAVVIDPSGNKVKLYWAGDNRLSPPWQVELGPL